MTTKEIQKYTKDHELLMISQKIEQSSRNNHKKIKNPIHFKWVNLGPQEKLKTNFFFENSHHLIFKTNLLKIREVILTKLRNLLLILKLYLFSNNYCIVGIEFLGVSENWNLILVLWFIEFSINFMIRNCTT